MEVRVNGRAVELLPGATVRHALLAAGLLGAAAKGAEALDEWGNRLGLDGALAEGMRVEVREVPRSPEAGEGGMA
jgi:hypothetical protein